MLHTSLESLSPDAIRARDAFLSLVNPSHKSHVTNLFLEQARAGVVKPSDIIARVLAVVTQRLAAAEDDSERQKWTAIRATLARPQALDFAAYTVHYARLPHETRQRMKAARALTYADAHMQTQPATPSQFTLLRRLGWQGDPPVSTRAEAAALIGAYLAGKAVSRG
jgi:hypothetical protein